jgi:[CysO sulfur-carrier protein]-S-L-cysteine hydrolase
LTIAASPRLRSGLIVWVVSCESPSSPSHPASRVAAARLRAARRESSAMGGSYVVGVRISRADYDELIAHAREEAPKECCGYARISDGRIDRIFRGYNERQSAYGFEMDFKSAMAANELEDDGFQVAAYHSHPRSPAEPSQQDRNINQYPHWLQLIVTLKDEPAVRAWWIVEGDVREEALEIE